MAEFLGSEYNYETFPRSDSRRSGGFELFKQIVHAGEPAIDFILPSIDGDTVTLSELHGKPVVMEFGSIT